MAKYTETREFALWAKYEDVAMHFNELLIRLRTQALGGLAGIIALSGLALNFAQKPESEAQWVILGSVLAFFALAWFALGILDLCYYDRLLQGAVAAIMAHEGRTPEIGGGADRRINLSTRISVQVPRHRRVIVLFYLLVFCGLLAGVYYTFQQAINWKGPKHDPTEYKIQFSQTDKLKVIVETPKPGGAP